MARKKVDPARLSIAAAARQLGVARETLYDWFNAGAPRNVDGTIKLAAIGRWLASERGRLTQTQRASDTRDRRDRAVAEREEIRTAQLKGTVVDREAVTGAAVQLVRDARDALLRGPAQLAVHCCARCRPTARKEWERVIRGILEELAARGGEL